MKICCKQTGAFSSLLHGKSSSKYQKFLWNFCFWGCKEAALLLKWHNFSVLCKKKALIMCMQMLANYADPYHHILSDALLREEKT